MPRIGLLNLIIGFLTIFVAASAGAFLGLEVVNTYITNKLDMLTWQIMLQKSAHAHTNLFGLLHIAFGLTIPYSKFSHRFKGWQTIGLSAGTVAMSVMMFMRSQTEPVSAIPDGMEIMTGAMLSLALAAIGTHVFGLWLNYSRRI